MADTNPELDAIKYLIKVESKANEMVKDASDEAEKRLAEARTAYNNLYKEKYEEALVVLNEKFAEKIQEIKAAHDKEIEDFKVSLENKSQNTAAFNKLLDKLLFE
ncbi:MAG: hypothetical protein SOZ96_06475 [Treponema sp.]|nr:hypothetical protein [Spirochaetia bacterium]MDY2839228.1 hypothetical protein [Treponema sp.]MDY3722220.1 hypothetical protein [Treponema sp.]MDY5124443.1 hypothetical protein [Treponema sp.]